MYSLYTGYKLCNRRTHTTTHIPVWTCHFDNF